jgi:hypothetical protein
MKAILTICCSFGFGVPPLPCRTQGSSRAATPSSQISGYVPGKIVIKFDSATLAGISRFPDRIRPQDTGPGSVG